MAIIVVPKYHRMGEGFSRAEKLKAKEHPGRKTTKSGYQSPAAWIGDLVDRGLCVLLCSFCKVKFNHARNHYRKKFLMDVTGGSSGWIANGQCDGCKQDTAMTGGGSMFMHEELWLKMSQDPQAARRNARKAWETDRKATKRGQVIDDMISNPNKYGKKHNTLWQEVIMSKGAYADKRHAKTERIKVRDKRRFK